MFFLTLQLKLTMDVLLQTLNQKPIISIQILHTLIMIASNSLTNNLVLEFLASHTQVVSVVGLFKLQNWVFVQLVAEAWEECAIGFGIA